MRKVAGTSFSTKLFPNPKLQTRSFWGVWGDAEHVFFRRHRIQTFS